ncbi:hypothetical protein CRUP_012365 [Coryphaenoides rupestris]|nr:hypothetical protein CRUP_012365 [Coryphaenoides rupestris]
MERRALALGHPLIGMLPLRVVLKLMNYAQKRGEEEEEETAHRPYVIHTVGPMARGRTGPSESSDLSSSYENSLKLLVENNLTTVVSAALRWEFQCLWSFKGSETLSLETV